jgi:hypothetical protein
LAGEMKYAVCRMRLREPKACQVLRRLWEARGAELR